MPGWCRRRGRPTTTRNDCARTSPVTFRVVAPSAMRTPISFPALLDEVRQHAEDARQGQEECQPAEHDRQPESDLQRICLHPAERAQRHHHAHVGIDGREAFEQRATGQLRIAGDACDQIHPGIRRARRNVHTRFGKSRDAKAGHVTNDAYDGERSGTVAWARPARGFPNSDPARGASPGRRRRASARSAAQRFRTPPRLRRS